MHKLHSYKGIILNSVGVGEKNLLVTIFSGGLGLVKAKAISAREAKGKLKGHIIKYSVGVYTLVRGKEGWRLIQAESEGNLMFDLYGLERKRLVGRVAKLLLSFAGEEPEPKLFSLVSSAFKVLPIVEKDSLKIFEAVLVARTLFILGYVSLDDLPGVMKNLDDFTEIALLEAKKFEKEIIFRINQGLKGSQLSKTV